MCTKLKKEKPLMLERATEESVRVSEGLLIEERKGFDFGEGCHVCWKRMERAITETPRGSKQPTK